MLWIPKILTEIIIIVLLTQKIVMIHSVASNESTSKKRKLDQRSLIWSHFTMNITDKKANCNYCTKSYNMAKANGSTDNLWNHYNRHHTKGNIIVPIYCRNNK